VPSRQQESASQPEKGTWGRASIKKEYSVRPCKIKYRYNVQKIKM
jgi:hypothetical protein